MKVNPITKTITFQSIFFRVLIPWKEPIVFPFESLILGPLKKFVLLECNKELIWIFWAFRLLFFFKISKFWIFRDFRLLFFFNFQNFILNNFVTARSHAAKKGWTKELSLINSFITRRESITKTSKISIFLLYIFLF